MISSTNKNTEPNILTTPNIRASEPKYVVKVLLVLKDVNDIIKINTVIV